jgi:hypothetical protein
MKQAVSSITDYIQKRAREDSFARQIFPFREQTWTDLIVHSSVRESYPNLIAVRDVGGFVVEIRQSSTPQADGTKNEAYIAIESFLFVEYPLGTSVGRKNSKMKFELNPTPSSDFLKACASQLDKVPLTPIQLEAYKQEIGWRNV